jgi:hypothetical protein
MFKKTPIEIFVDLVTMSLATEKLSGTIHAYQGGVIVNTTPE